MIIFPAIDIKDGNCVRLIKGDFNTASKVASDPLEAALDFYNQGARYLHMVDLDGAVKGEPKNADIFINVAKNTNMFVQLGGGIRSLETVEYYLSKGIGRVILGSAAVKNKELVKTAVKEYGEKIAVGIDAKNGMVASEGWLSQEQVDYITLALEMSAIGVSNIIFTDISRDGTLSGPNLEQLDNINRAASANIIASGGIRDINDIRAIKRLGLYAAICGKSIYQKTLDLREAISEAGV